MPDLRRHSSRTHGRAASMTTSRAPTAMIATTAATLREVESRQNDPNCFLQVAPVLSATLGLTAVRVIMLTPQSGWP